MCKNYKGYFNFFFITHNCLKRIRKIYGFSFMMFFGVVKQVGAYLKSILQYFTQVRALSGKSKSNSNCTYIANIIKYFKFVLSESSFYVDIFLTCQCLKY
jgi:hypothetical protein